MVRRLREVDASKKTNYAVQIRNMGSGYISLLTGTKSQCEDLIRELEDLENAYTEYDDDYASEANEEFIEYILPRYDCIEEINWREIDNRNNYYDHDTGKTYHIINDVFYDVYF